MIRYSHARVVGRHRWVHRWTMAATVSTAAELIPDDADLDRLREIAGACTACDLYKSGTQTVFGEGPGHAEVMLVGEQPGDREDLAGKPFVGPAGKLLDEALGEAGIDRSRVYITNVVKHFKWVPRGKRRIHKKPNAAEITACKPWLEAEIARVRPRVVVCLGATAAQALLGRDFRVTQHRGELVETDMEPLVTATVHPSSIIRDPETRAAELPKLVADLAAVARQLERI
ncbi:MAG: UdgX family uracil-DNA binding protein [Actinomycetota bacterium]